MIELPSKLLFISGIFTPILPVITAAGIIKAVLFLVVFKVVAVDDVNHQVLNFIADADFIFTCIFRCFSTDSLRQTLNWGC
ncbi:MAG: hypothetical protein ACLS3V_05850 [Streptococcus sp.]